MKEVWDKRYSSQEYIYGIQANSFLKEQITGIKPGKILLPGDGEGRNAVYTAKMGWDVTAFDYSISAKEKALKLAKEFNISIDYLTSDVESFNTNERFDLISIIYLHLPDKERFNFHQKLEHFLSPGGKIILECFSKAQISNNSGGPKNIELLYSIDDLKKDFNNLTINYFSELNIELNEGPLHQGKASVIRMIAQKD